MNRCGATTDRAANPAVAAAAYEANLFARAGAPFGSPSARRYAFFQIGGLSVFNPANPAEPHPSTAPVVTTTCPTGTTAGRGYQTLAILTNGLRFSTCETNSYGAYMTRIAEEAAVLYAALNVASGR